MTLIRLRNQLSELLEKGASPITEVFAVIDLDLADNVTSVRLTETGEETKDLIGSIAEQEPGWPVVILNTSWGEDE